MATSGVTTWTLNRDAVIKGALRKLAVLPSGGTPTANQTSDAQDALNAIIKACEADGMPVWKITSLTFTVVSGTNTYTVGPSVTASSTSFVAPQPLKVIESVYTPLGGNNTHMNIYNRNDYMELPNTASGMPVNIYCQPLGYSNNTVVKLWPIPNDNTTTITLYYQAPYEDVTASTDNLDFPAYWIQALIYLLAWALAPEYGIPPNDRNILAGEAKFWKDQALSYGSEEGGIFFQVRSS